MTDTPLYAGLDLGGTTLQAGIGPVDGDLLANSEVATEAHQGPERVIERMIRLIHELEAKAGGKVRGLGVGCPGWIDATSGITKFLPNLPTQWREVPLAARLGEALGVEVKLMNDARLATLGELRYGHGRGRRDPTLVLFTLGTGIGGGVVVDGRLRLGPLGAAGEIGHMTVVQDGRSCSCGSRGCVEAYASAPAIVGEAVRLLRGGRATGLWRIVEEDLRRVTPQTIAEAAEAGDADAASVLEEAARTLGIAVANIVVTLHPDLVVLSGGVALIGERLLAPVREVVGERVQVFPPSDVEVVCSKLGNRAGVLGGVALTAAGASAAGGQARPAQE